MSLSSTCLLPTDTHTHTYTHVTFNGYTSVQDGQQLPSTHTHTHTHAYTHCKRHSNEHLWYNVHHKYKDLSMLDTRCSRNCTRAIQNLLTATIQCSTSPPPGWAQKNNWPGTRQVLKVITNLPEAFWKPTPIKNMYNTSYRNRPTSSTTIKVHNEFSTCVCVCMYTIQNAR